MWFVDRHVRGLPFNLGSPAANLVATRGLEKLRINARQKLPFRAFSLRSQKPFKMAERRGENDRAARQRRR
jgi:hypothetical protein